MDHHVHRTPRSGAALTDDQRAEIDDVSAMLTSNLEKITEHGKRADGIVKAMLEHSRGSSGERRMVDLNAQIDEQDITRMFLNLFANGIYAATKPARNGADAGFEPTLKVTTRDAGEAVQIGVRDNGTGIPADIRDKLVPAVLRHQADRRGHRPRPVDHLRHRHAAT